jgi:hypothetical protein
MATEIGSATPWCYSVGFTSLNSFHQQLFLIFDIYHSKSAGIGIVREFELRLRAQPGSAATVSATSICSLTNRPEQAAQKG